MFSTQGLVDHYGILPREVIYLTHITIIAWFGWLVLCDIYRWATRDKIFKYHSVEIILLLFIIMSIIVILIKNMSLLVGLIGLKNLLMFPMVYYIIRRTKKININEFLKLYVFILFLQIPVILYQGISTGWDDEMLTGTFGYHTTGINGVIYTAIAALGIIKYLLNKNKKTLLLVLFLIIPGISGIRAAFILLAIVALGVGIYNLLFIKNKIILLIKGFVVLFTLFIIVDYTHLAVEKVKISTLYSQRFEQIMHQQVFGYGTFGGNDQITHFGRISSLLYVWNDLNKNGKLLYGYGPGMARDSLFGERVSFKGGFKFQGSPGGLATIWYEYGIIGILIYTLMIIKCISLLFSKTTKNYYLSNDPYLLWGMIIGLLYLFGNIYTTLWHTYAAFHFWLIMSLIIVNIENKTYKFSYIPNTSLNNNSLF